MGPIRRRCHGDPAGGTVDACEQPPGYAYDADDCNDADANIGPRVADGPPLSCDGVDNDCNGTPDDGLTSVRCYTGAWGCNLAAGTCVATTYSTPSSRRRMARSRKAQSAAAPGWSAMISREA